MGATPQFRSEDQDGSTLEIHEVDGTEWRPLIISVTDENGIPVSVYLGLADEARLASYLLAHMRSQP
jgi:hypothetical protein